jgi:hypothetical protein
MYSGLNDDIFQYNNDTCHTTVKSKHKYKSSVSLNVILRKANHVWKTSRIFPVSFTRLIVCDDGVYVQYFQSYTAGNVAAK